MGHSKSLNRYWIKCIMKQFSLSGMTEDLRCENMRKAAKIHGIGADFTAKNRPHSEV